MSGAELVAVIRDLTIVLFAMVGVLAMLIATVVGLSLYRKVAPTLDSAKATLKNAQEVTSQLSEKVVKPLISASTKTFTAGRVVAFLLGLSRGRGKGGKKDGE
ncbi:MAG: hypothetical protein O2783_02400 [Chloroflexi bacterium]|nr:hypothetical protein [Chloroflexota bacterium]